jgi:hypothetical protein
MLIVMLLYTSTVSIATIDTSETDWAANLICKPTGLFQEPASTNGGPANCFTRSANNAVPVAKRTQDYSKTNESIWSNIIVLGNKD